MLDEEGQEIKRHREQSIREILDRFFWSTAINLITDDGGSSFLIDSALEIDRRPLVAESMIKIGKELLNNENFGSDPSTFQREGTEEGQ